MIVTRKKFLAGAVGVAATMVASRAAVAQTQPPQTQPPDTRGEVGSARNIAQVRRVLDRLIMQLEQDQRDFGGYRVRAIEDMHRARANLEAALQWDATHSH
jgi:hypothetical protein